MSKFAISLTVLGVAAGLMLPVAPAQAQATRTWVSGVGDDVNPCSRTAPCKTFAGAISKTAENGEINCLDPGGFGGVTITKSISIDCHEVLAGIVVAGTNAIIINFDSFNAAGRKNVYLRNLNLNGVNTGLNGIRIIGGANSANSSVTVEDFLIENFFGAPGRGISDERSGGGKLNVSNTTIVNNGGTGIAIAPASGATKIDVSIHDVRVRKSLFGVAAGSGARVMISKSVFSGNTNAGIESEGPAGASEVNVNDSVSSANGIGLQTLAGGTIRISNTDVAFNTTGISGSAQSFGNNRFSTNGAGGPTNLIAPNNTNASGQQ